jgi:hypothetical protein
MVAGYTRAGYTESMRAGYAGLNGRTASRVVARTERSIARSVAAVAMALASVALVVATAALTRQNRKGTDR